MTRTVSRDGTPIAFDQSGEGPPLILVDGALCHRASGPAAPLAALLKDEFTVFTYDRRGRGESGDRGLYTIEREVEDLEAVISEAGMPAFVYGVSSGAALALEAAHRGLPIQKLALYEAPFIVDDSRPSLPGDFLARLNDALATGRRGEAVTLFMQLVGVPAMFIAMVRVLPVWSKLKAVAHTLPYDIRLTQDYQRGQPLPPAQWAGARMPTLVMNGGKSPAWIRRAMQSLADVLPNTTYHTLAGQTHMVKPKAHVPALVKFFTGREAATE